jgi:hypothetical protein
MPALPQSINNAIKAGFSSENIQLRLAMISDEPSYSNRTNAINQEHFNRVNIKVFDEHGLVPMNDVLISNMDDASLTKFKTGGAIAIMAMIGKNRASESCVILGFINPQADAFGSTIIEGSNKSTNSALRARGKP